MPYLDADQKFYDYGTKIFDGSNPFDVRKTGVSFYNQFFTDPDYMEEYKNLKHKIIELSPKEYFRECAKIFNSTYENQINQTKADKQTLAHLKEVLQKYKKTFPITFLNYAENSQEGRHRMYVVGELLGWDKKFPVMIVEHADEQKYKIEKETSEKALKQDIIYNIEKAIDSVNSFDCEDLDEFKTELELQLNYNLSTKISPYIKIIQNDQKEQLDFYYKYDLIYSYSIYKLNLQIYPYSFTDDDIDINDLL